VSICPNLARTAAIEVCLPFNFAVVFDFTYFRFRASKAKSIGDVLTNRHNAANCCLRSVYNFQILFRGFFFLCAAHPLMAQTDPVRQ
jgi:hypothetical protein